MSTPPDPAGQQPAPPPAAPAAAPGSPPDAEAARVKSLDDRFGKLETEQARQGTVLEQILTKVGAAPGGSGTVTPASTGHAPADLAAQMRQAVRDVGAEREAAARKAGGAAADAPRPEQRPRERRAPLRARLQKGIFGIDDSPGSKQQ